MTDFYLLLGIDRGADLGKIKSAYRRSAKRLHPDLSPGGDAAEKFKQVTEAYETLADAQKRRRYDETLRRGEAIAPAAPIEDLVPGPDSARRVPGRAGFASPRPPEIRPLGSHAPATPGPRQDLHAELVLSPREAREGIRVAVPLAQSCPACRTSFGRERLFCAACHGTGRLRSRVRFHLSLPPRVAPGTDLTISLDPVGLPGVRLLLRIRVDPFGLY